MQEIRYDPGIFGFVKAHRHRTGSVLAMALHDEHDPPVYLMYWVKRLHPFAKPYWIHSTAKYRRFADAEYDLMYWCGPPPFAICDRQRARVYDWEEHVIYPGHREWTWLGCQRFFRRVWNVVGNGQDMILTNKRRYECAIALDGMIHLPPSDTEYFYRAPIILHEVAHQLAPGQQHNGNFVRVYIALCVRFLGMDEAVLRDTASQYDIEFT